MQPSLEQFSSSLNTLGEQGQAQGLAWETMTVSPCPGHAAPHGSLLGSTTLVISTPPGPGTQYAITKQQSLCQAWPAKRHDTNINITTAKLGRCCLCVCWIWSEASITCPKYTNLQGKISKKVSKAISCLVFLEFSEQDVLSYSLLHILPQQTFKRPINIETQYYRLLLGQIQEHHQDNLNS